MRSKSGSSFEFGSLVVAEVEVASDAEQQDQLKPKHNEAIDFLKETFSTIFRSLSLNLFLFLS